MELNGATKVFLQLQPDISGIQCLVGIQDRLSKNRETIIVPQDQLHMTIIHVGALHRIIAAVNTTTSIADQDLFNNAKKLVADFQTIASSADTDSITTTSSTFDRFGPTGKTAVVTFTPTPTIQQLHTRGLNALTNFLLSCGVTDPHGFMQSDANLKNALKLHPHITIAKNYSGSKPTVIQNTITLNPMQIIY